MRDQVPTYERRELTYSDYPTETCTRCGDAEAAPGRFADRCSACIETLARGDI